MFAGKCNITTGDLGIMIQEEMVNYKPSRTDIVDAHHSGLQHALLEGEKRSSTSAFYNVVQKLVITKRQSVSDKELLSASVLSGQRVIIEYADSALKRLKDGRLKTQNGVLVPSPNEIKWLHNRFVYRANLISTYEQDHESYKNTVGTLTYKVAHNRLKKTGENDLDFIVKQLKNVEKLARILNYTLPVTYKKSA